MANRSPATGTACGLVHFDLPTVFRIAVELAQAVAALPPAEWADFPEDIDGPDAPEAPRWHQRANGLDRIAKAANRLKRSLGAAGQLEFQTDHEATWQSYDDRFKSTDHDHVVRLSLLKLAFAAMDLSGFGTWRKWQHHMRDTGLRLLTWGIAQLWEGMTDDERANVRSRLPRAHAAIGWPSDPATDPPAYQGPERIPEAEGYRPITNYVTCLSAHQNANQKAERDRVGQEHGKFLRLATIVQVVEHAERAEQAFRALACRDFVTRLEAHDLYRDAFWPLLCLRRAHEVAPRAPWSDAALEQRRLLAEAAEVLVPLVGDFLDAMPTDKQQTTNKALDDFAKAACRLREEAANPRAGLTGGSEGGKAMPSSSNASGAERDEGELPTKKRIPSEEAEILVRDWLLENAKKNPTAITRDAVAACTGVSAGAVSNTAAWKAFRDRRDAEAKPANRETSLTTAMLAVVSSDCPTPAQLAEINEIFRAGEKEEAEQERRSEQAKKIRRQKPS